MAQNMKRGAPSKGKDAKMSAKAQPTGQLTGNPSAAPGKSGANVKLHPGSKPKGR